MHTGAFFLHYNRNCLRRTQTWKRVVIYQPKSKLFCKTKFPECEKTITKLISQPICMNTKGFHSKILSYIQDFQFLNFIRKLSIFYIRKYVKVFRTQRMNLVFITIVLHILTDQEYYLSKEFWIFWFSLIFTASEENERAIFDKQF